MIEEKKEGIKLVQKPILEYNIDGLAKQIKEKIDGLNIENQVATEETLKYLKDSRADLNKDFANHDGQRKTVKKLLHEPYSVLETEFKEKITSQYDKADTLLKSKVALVEDKVKADKEESLKAYFTELVDSYDIDFLKYSDLNLAITITKKEKKYKEEMNDHVERVSGDRDHINTLADKDEIFIEYKGNGLNALKAISVVQTRKAELKAVEDEKLAKALIVRKNQLIAAGLLFDAELNVFVYDDELNITHDAMKVMDDNTFAVALKGIIGKVEEKIKANLADQKVEEEPVQGASSAQGSPTPAPKAEAIKAPTQQTVKIVPANFHVEAPLSVLHALGAYMKENGIKYENITVENVNQFII